MVKLSLNLQGVANGFMPESSLGDLVEDFLNTAANAMHRIKTHHEKNAFEDLATAVYELKCRAGSVGEGELYRICSEIEKNALHRRMQIAAPLVDLLERQITSSRQGLVAERSRRRH